MASRNNTHTNGDSGTAGNTPDAVKAKPNINTVSAADFHKLHITGLTGDRVESIINWRDSHGGKFDSFEDINEVPMIGHTMVEQIKSHFICE